MVNTIKLLGAFDGNHIADALNHANDILLAHGIATNGANISIGHIEATLAEFDLAPHPCYGFAEMTYFWCFLLQ